MEQESLLQAAREGARGGVRQRNRAVSKADFANKIGIVQKEASETQYWLEIIQESELDSSEGTAALHQEATELLAIFTTIGRKLKETKLEE